MQKAGRGLTIPLRRGLPTPLFMSVDAIVYRQFSEDPVVRSPPEAPVVLPLKHDRIQLSRLRYRIGSSDKTGW